MLTEVKTNIYCYFVDKNDNLHGEYKWWHENGQLYEHCFYLGDDLHGEYRRWHDNGQLAVHCFYENDNNITNQVEQLVNDISNMTEEERFLIKLNFGIPLC